MSKTIYGFAFVLVLKLCHVLTTSIMFVTMYSINQDFTWLGRTTTLSLGIMMMLMNLLLGAMSKRFKKVYEE